MGSVKKQNFKRMSIIALLILSAVSINANPLSYILGSEATGLDVVYIILGISAIWMLIFFEGYNSEEKEENASLPIRTIEENRYQRRIVKKTS